MAPLTEALPEQALRFRDGGLELRVRIWGLGFGICGRSVEFIV